MKEPRTFLVARTSVVFAVMTGFVLLIPIAFAFIGYATPMIRAPMLASAALVLVLTLATALYARPTRFEVGDEGVVVVWPMRRQVLARASISRVHALSKRELEAKLGGAVRVGVGGLFGVFGLLKTGNLGWVSCYVTAIEPLVLIERTEGRAWLISPADPEAFARRFER